MYAKSKVQLKMTENFSPINLMCRDVGYDMIQEYQQRTFRSKPDSST